MNMNDYKNAVKRMHMKSDLKTEIIETSVEKNSNKFGRFSERAISIAVSAAICLSTFTVIIGVATVFKDVNKLKPGNTSFMPGTSFNENSEPTSDDISNRNIAQKTAVLKTWDPDYLYSIFGINEYYDYTLDYGDGHITFKNSDDNIYNYIDIVAPLRSTHVQTDVLTTDEIKQLENNEIYSLNKNDSIQKANDIINKLNISAEVKKVYALDVDTLIKLDTTRSDSGVRVNDGNELPEWTTSQEAYLITYDVSYDSLQMREAYSCCVIIDRSGLAYLDVCDIFDVQDDVMVNICPADKAAASISFFWSKFMGYEPYIDDINKNCRLVYVVQLNEKNLNSSNDLSNNEDTNDEDIEYILTPYWEFTSENFSSWFDNLDIGYLDYYYRDTLIVDAVTGEFDPDMNFG